MVFVHGYTGDASDWREQIDAFAGHRLLLIENVGHGRSEASSQAIAYSVLAMADDVEGIIDEVEIDRYHLIGHSIGGAVVQEIVLRSAERVISLTLVDTTTWFGDHEARGESPYTPPERQAEMELRVQQMSKDALVLGWQGLLTWAGTGNRANEISTPTLVIHGSRDALPIIEGSGVLAEMIPNARLAVIEGSGHAPQLERPEAFNSLLREFVASVE